MFQINLVGVINSIEAASISKVKRYLFSSAAGVYGNNISDPIYETAPASIRVRVRLCKNRGGRSGKNYGLECAVLRIGFVYGPGRVHECPIAMLVREVQATGKANWPSGRDQYLDFIHIDDTVDGFIGAIAAPKLNYKIYNLGGGRLTPYQDVIKIVNKLYPQAQISVGPGGLGYDDIGRMDNSRALEDFGYAPKVSLEQGIEGYAQWLKTQE